MTTTSTNGHAGSDTATNVSPLVDGKTEVASHKAIDHLSGAAPVKTNMNTATGTAGSEKQTSLAYPKPRVSLVDRFLDEPRKLRVAVIGGGLSGILSGVLLPEKVPGIELVIYEKNPDFVSSLRLHSSNE